MRHFMPVKLVSSSEYWAEGEVLQLMTGDLLKNRRRLIVQAARDSVCANEPSSLLLPDINLMFSRRDRHCPWSHAASTGWPQRNNRHFRFLLIFRRADVTSRAPRRPACRRRGYSDIRTGRRRRGYKLNRSVAEDHTMALHNLTARDVGPT